MRFRTFISAATCCVSALVSCETYASGDSQLGGVLSAWSCGVKLCAGAGNASSPVTKGGKRLHCSFLGALPSFESNVISASAGYSRPSESLSGRAVSLPKSELYSTLKSNEVRFAGLHSKIDSNSDGLVSKAEVDSFFKSDKNGSSRKIWDDLVRSSEDHSGSVPKSQFLVLADTLFGKFDLDRNNILDPYELSQTSLNQLGIYKYGNNVLSKYSCAGLIAADLNANGSVSRDELINYAEFVTSTIDIDYDGIVSQVEFNASNLSRCFDDKFISVVIRELLKKSGNEVALEDILDSVDASFASLDVTSDGELSNDEYQYYLSNGNGVVSGVVSGVSSEKYNGDKALFSSTDSDRSRYVSPKEFADFLTSKIILIDYNGDGLLTESEFIRYKERQDYINKRLKRNPSYVKLIYFILAGADSVKLQLTPAYLKSFLEEYFDLLDKNSDHSLSRSEFSVEEFDSLSTTSSSIVGSSVDSPDYDHIISSYDDNGDGSLSEVEYLNFLKSIFSSLDADVDKNLTVSELYRSAQGGDRLRLFGVFSFGASDVKDIVNRMDVNTDGFVSLSEYEIAAKNIFLTYDMDKSGSLSKNELAIAYKSMKRSASLVTSASSGRYEVESELQDLFKRIDQDGSSGVSKAEFRNYEDLIFRNMDGDSDGVVRRNEYDVYYDLRGSNLPSMDNAEVVEYYDKKFLSSDINNNGIISSAESLVKADSVFEEMDNNGDGNVVPSELKVLYNKMAGRAVQIGGAVVSNVRDVAVFADQDLRDMDVDSNGSVTLSEFIDYQDAILVRADSDRSSGVTSDEFKVFVSENSTSKDYGRIRFHRDVFQQYKSLNDTDSDGEITFRENRQLYSDLFLEIDEDGSATLNAGELLGFYKKIGVLASPAGGGRPEGVNFSEMDADKSGGVSLSEHRNFFSSRMFSMDANHDGAVTKSEADSFYDKNFTMYSGSKRIEHKRLFDKSFSEADQNSDKTVTQSELYAFSDLVFNDSDSNGDGLISLKEAEKDHRDRYGVSGVESGSDLVLPSVHDEDGNFSQMDSNGSGGVSQEENRSFYRGRILAVDANGDGSVSGAESESFYKANFGELTGEYAERHKKLYAKAFADADINSDGSISSEEIIAFANSVFLQSDSDGNGTLSREEVLADHDTRYRPESHELSSSHEEDGNFAQMDSDSSGAVTKEENRNFYKSSISRFDSNGDGFVSKQESDKYYYSNSFGVDEKNSKNHKDLFDKAFNDADLNSDGSVSSDEIIGFSDKVFADSDLNGNGSLSPEEVKKDHDLRYRNFSSVDDSVHDEYGNFSQMDVDHSGLVSNEENRSFYVSRIKSFDSNGDGLVTKAESDAYYEVNFSSVASEDSLDHQMLFDKAFAEADADSNLTITLAEITSFADKIMSQSDINRDGSLSSDEVRRDHDSRYTVSHKEDGNFNAMDQDQSGSVTPSENRAFYVKRIDVMDSNRDGKISRPESDSFFYSNFGEGSASNVEGRKKLVDKVFVDCDSNGDGYVSIEELRNYADKVFKESDSDGNGSLSLHEAIVDHDKRYVIGKAGSTSGVASVAGSLSGEGRGLDVFKEIDKNEDKTVSRDELRKFYDGKFVAMDRDKSRVVLLSELDWYVKSNIKSNDSRDADVVTNVFLRYFKDADSNSDSKLTSDEVKAFADSDFDLIDANSDGLLSMEEVVVNADVNYYQKSTDLGDIFSYVDINNDMLISQAEFEVYYRDNFRVIDSDGDMYVSQYEIKKLINDVDDFEGGNIIGRFKLGDANGDSKVSLQENLVSAELEFQALDTDRDGYVNMEELSLSK